MKCYVFLDAHEVLFTFRILSAPLIKPVKKLYLCVYRQRNFFDFEHCWDPFPALTHIYFVRLAELPHVPPKSLNVYDFSMKMYTSQPITALLGRKAELPFGWKVYFFMPKSYMFRNFDGRHDHSWWWYLVYNYDVYDTRLGLGVNCLSYTTQSMIMSFPN